MTATRAELRKGFRFDPRTFAISKFEPEDSSDEEDAELTPLTLPVIMRAAKRAKAVAKARDASLEEYLNAEDIFLMHSTYNVCSFFDPDCHEHLEEPTVKKEIKSLVSDLSKGSISFGAVLNTVRQLLSSSVEANVVFLRNAGVSTLFKHLRTKNDVRDATQGLEVLTIFFTKLRLLDRHQVPLEDAFYRLLVDLAERVALFPEKGERSDQARRTGKVYRHNWLAALHLLCDHALYNDADNETLVRRSRNVVFGRMLEYLRLAFKRQDLVAVKHVFDILT
jgi:hypothetical protein